MLIVGLGQYRETGALCCIDELHGQVPFLCGLLLLLLVYSTVVLTTS